MDLGRRFDGRNVLVVGGGADGPPRPGETLAMGNGRAIALRLGAEGASVAVTDRNLDSARETVAALSGRGVALQADAAEAEACRAAVDDATAALGSLDVVILNVGIASGLPLHAETVDDWRWHEEVNVRSHWLTAQTALPGMIERGGGAFVFVSSVAALLGGSGLAYEATKAAQVAVSRHIAVRYAKRGIRSNCLLLGLIDSTMVRREFGSIKGRMDKRAAAPPMRRQGRPEEVAAAAAFLASEDASYVNGTTLVVDGGLSATAG
jgi:NAD(P)-dependent dehydrogenase (short-subunit alcohol dehydrogenase family)